MCLSTAASLSRKQYVTLFAEGEIQSFLAKFPGRHGLDSRLRPDRHEDRRLNFAVFKPQRPAPRRARRILMRYRKNRAHKFYPCSAILNPAVFSTLHPSHRVLLAPQTKLFAVGCGLRRIRPANKPAR